MNIIKTRFLQKCGILSLLVFFCSWSSPGVVLSDFAVFSLTETNLRDRVFIENGNVGSNRYIEIGCDATVDGSVLSTSGKGFFRDRSHIMGDVRLGQDLLSQNNFTIEGMLEEKMSSPYISIPEKSIAYGQESFQIKDLQSLSLEPGTYNTLKGFNRIHLSLSSGVYNFYSFETGPDTTIDVHITGSQPVEINIANTMLLGDRTVINLVGNESPAMLKIYTNQEQQFRLGPDSVMRGIVTAPHAQIYAYARTAVYGALYAENIYIEEHVKFNGEIQVNRAPIAYDDHYTTEQNTILTIDAPGILSNDEDPDGDELEALLVDAPKYGTLELQPDGLFVYTPNDDFYGIDQFTYKAFDGELASNIAVVTIQTKFPFSGELYAVNNSGDGDSQLIKLDINSGTIVTLGPLHENAYLTGIGFQAETLAMYAASGNADNSSSVLYSIDKDTGLLTEVGPIFSSSTNIYYGSTAMAVCRHESYLTFFVKGTNRGENPGIVRINAATGKGYYRVKYDAEIEAITWDYASNGIFMGTGKHLLYWDFHSGTSDVIEKACFEALPANIKALEVMPDERIITLMSFNGVLYLYALDYEQGTVAVIQTFDYPEYDNIDSLAWYNNFNQ